MTALDAREAMPGTLVQALTDEQLQLVRATIAPGRTFAPHSHPHEQFILVLDGALELTIADETKTPEAGGVFYMAPEVPHGARVMPDRDVVLIEVLHPIRKDYLDTERAASHDRPH